MNKRLLIALCSALAFGAIREEAKAGTSVVQPPPGWTQIGQTVIGSAVASVDFTSIPANYTSVMIVAKNMQCTAAGTAVRFGVGTGSFNQSGDLVSCSNVSANGNVTTICENIRTSSGSCVATFTANTADNLYSTGGALTAVDYIWLLASNLTRIQIVNGGATTFSAGTVTLYGR